MLWTGQFGLKGVEHGEFEGEACRVSSALVGESARCRPCGCLRQERNRLGAST